MGSPVIAQVDAVTLEGKRPRPAGSNARLGFHGDTVRMPVVRLTTSDGVQGFGRARVDSNLLASLPGRPLDQFITGSTAHNDWTVLELPLIDLAARLAGEPYYRFSGGQAFAEPKPFRSYDTSLYFDDLDLESDEEAAALIASEARDGWERGHRAFKIKLGRGARHMPLEKGTIRDLAVTRAVREAVGPDAIVMIDANNGWNLNITKQVLSDLAEANLYWVEEAFHEDNVLYQDLHEWIAAEGLDVLIADGEGMPDPRVVEWSKQGLIDVVQDDIFSRGFGSWRSLAPELDALDVAFSPHTYGGGIGPYVSAQLAAMFDRFNLVEWDEIAFPEIDASGYTIDDGWVSVPTTPGFGLELDTEAFEAAVASSGISLRHA